ncbi:hypothetical protein A2335_00630 [Candidatus Peregrinibacteria bacterium RIFOXYB2_FULL_32_7]|nr:MAG: hypothetical protein A2335_00630 [Candidatus Peregrinibacteria bacterium RIFOXYB2_FULL_32_7]
MKNFLKNKKVLLGISSSIAVVKIPKLIEILSKKGAEIEVVATKNALKLIDVKEIEKVLNKKVWIDMFDDKKGYPHIDLAKWADLILLAPATANLIGKICSGLADDLLTTIMLVFQGNVFVAPAMNFRMWNNFFVQENLNKLIETQFKILEPQEGKLACGEEGMGRMMEVADIVFNIEKFLTNKNLLVGKTILITVGATREYLDPVRFISNGSSGKMGMALVKAAVSMGGKVILIRGQCLREMYSGAFVRGDDQLKIFNVESGEEMFEAVKANIDQADIFISAAAICDFKPEKISKQKIKKKNEILNIKFQKTVDILEWVGRKCKIKNTSPTCPNDLFGQKDLFWREKLKIIGFALESENLIENARKKLLFKNLDMIIANQPENIGAQEGEFWFIDKTTEIFKKGRKEDIAIEILKKISQQSIDFLENKG